MTKYVNETLELDVETITKLQEIAKENNATIDEVVNELLTDYMSKKIKLDEFIKILQDNNHDEIANYYTILDNNDKPIIRISPLR